MGLKSKRKPVLTRDQAMSARPYRMPGIQCRRGEDGSISVSIRFQRSGWQRWFGAPEEYEKRYELDSLGKEVFESCDGKTAVRAIVKQFAASHHLNAAEAEIAVTQYVKTLMAKRIIGMAVD